jgi:hypothetical protein
MRKRIHVYTFFSSSLISEEWEWAGVYYQKQDYHNLQRNAR